MCICHINPPCGYCTGEWKEKDEDEYLRQNAIRLDSGEMAKVWFSKNPGKCIWCKKSREVCYC